MRPAKIIVFTIIALLIVLGALVGANALVALLLIAIDQALGLNLTEKLGGFGGSILLLWLIWMMPKDWLSWNKTYECRGTAHIAAKPEDVWHQMRLRERENYFTPGIGQIRAIPGSDDEFEMHFVEQLEDEDIGCPKFAHAKLVDEVENEYLAYQVLNVDEMPSFGRDHLMTEIILERQEDGTKVTYIDTLSRIRPTTFLALLFLNPARDALRSLKAQMEGTEDPSILVKLVNSVDENGAPTGEVKSALWVAGATAMVVTTGLVAAVLYLIFYLIDKA